MLFASGRRAPSRWVEEDAHRRGDEALLAEIKRLAGTDTRILGDDEVLRMVLPAIRSDYRVGRFPNGDDRRFRRPDLRCRAPPRPAHWTYTQYVYTARIHGV
ncbi:surfactin synthase thioesterase subunit [Streptomyces turgidiscabies]|uniref:Surfactin synthase thioesterase subunit n=2 Tax=Streptomyces turgidiscabies TaxID=85558 RepID=A0ABU0RYS4_9ACTN|nr:surfactin synthase thioesterase subunit [Streptomyces turgidiscabies]